MSIVLGELFPSHAVYGSYLATANKMVMVGLLVWWQLV